MKFTFVAVAVATASLFPSLASTEAFTSKAFFPRGGATSSITKTSHTHLSATSSASMVQVPTKPIAGMKPGTSGLRKKVEVWQGKDADANEFYVQNFIQSLLDTAKAKNDGNVPKTLIVAGDGRYFNAEAIQIICQVLAGNGVENIW
ncbi:MAG: hypothetical protein SGARI_007224, partial [Bacillariaceae sp.]